MDNDGLEGLGRSKDMAYGIERGEDFRKKCEKNRKV